MSTLHGHPEVTTFVDLVRLFLGDLDDEALDELTGGLEANMVDLVEERGIEALPDPEVYADELRAAADLPARPRPRHPGRPRAGATLRAASCWLDVARDRFLAWAGAERRAPAWEGLVALRPVWWVARAWVAVQWADQLLGGWPHHWFPQVGPDWVGALLLGGAVVVSVQVGRGQWWPGGRGRPAGRMLLVAANLTLLGATVPVTVDVDQAVDVVEQWQGYEDGFRDGRGERGGLRLDGRRICHVEVLDGDGEPLSDVRLVGPGGREIPVDDRRC